MPEKMLQVALIGQPNVGKSSLFSRLTGVGVISSNYSGTTVEFEESVIKRNGVNVRVHDLPGTYSISGNSADEDVAIRMLSDPDNDAVVLVADATNLESSLVLCFEVMELGLPVILALNKFDASKKRFDTDVDALSNYLGIPVIPVSAKTSEGVDNLADAICAGKATVSAFQVKYSNYIERSITVLIKLLGETRFSKRGKAVKLLEGTQDFIDGVPDDVQEKAEIIRNSLKELLGESPNIEIGRDRYAHSDILIKTVQKKTQRPQTRAEKISDLTIAPITGVPILAAIFAIMFLSIIYLGEYLSGAVEWTYDVCIGDFIDNLAGSLGGNLELILIGINGSIRAILSLLIAYILVFYLILGVLEDSGYLPRAVVLLDSLMHKFGLHGGAFIPMMVGIGCNVPAILATRSIHSRRERLIVISMIVMAVPCSAQMAIIMGVTGKYAGVEYALAILVMLLVLIGITGLVLNKFLKSEPSNLAMELPDLVMPQAKNVLYKTWERIKDFFIIAFPMLVVGSVVVEILLAYNALNIIVDPLSFITVGMLGLPAVVIIAFLVGILRKEMSVALLVILAAPLTLDQFMTPEQFVVFGVVMAVFMPCLATFTVMGREIGWKDTAIIAFVSMAVAILIGSLFNMIFIAF
ncbi:MAG: ferrous iron transport protein B [Candidatus Methanomethylophilaceae archaeon]|nr:ferrous iron transport protein B [Candidatus Methanomethylophilaceae archaeon]MDD3378647.1 ferrous iron transport protein B [Candidatus Methanomethylophilaceae archaeon]MDY0223960.1 ferrous iron transport protein B [Candidatus Methanomethylophilaceae archaeon]